VRAPARRAAMFRVFLMLLGGKICAHANGPEACVGHTGLPQKRQASHAACAVAGVSAVSSQR
jgi:hypothetical protein